MKFISTVAAIAALANGLKIESEAEAQVSAATEAIAEAQVETTAEVKAESEASSQAEVKVQAQTLAQTEAKTEAKAETKASTEQLQPKETGWNGPIVPEDYYKAVKTFDMSKPTTNQDEYKKQLDIYSDQVIAIEALRVEVMKLDYAITEAQNSQGENSAKVRHNAERIVKNHQLALDNKASIEKLKLDIEDVGQCLSRQYHEQGELRGVLELYCHQFTYVAKLPYQCEQVLGAGSMLHQVYAWPKSGAH